MRANPHDSASTAQTALETGTLTAIELPAALLGAVGEAVIATDPAGRILYWNEAATRLFGWSAEEVEGADLVELTAFHALRDHARGILRAIRRGETWTGEFLVQNRDGRIFPVHSTDSPVYDAGGELIAIVGVSREVTGRHRAEAELRETEQRIDLIQRAATSAIWEWDVGADRVRWSDALGDAFGYAREDIESTLRWREERIHPDDRARVVDGVAGLVERGGHFWTDEYRFRTADGSYAQVFDRAYVARDEDGTAVRVVGMMHDLTERRRTQEAQRFLAQVGMILDLSLDYESTLPTIARLATGSACDYCILLVPGGGGFSPFSTASHGDAGRQGTLDALAGLLAAGLPHGSVIERSFRENQAVLMPRVPPTLFADLLDSRVRKLAQDLAPSSLVFAPLRARGTSVGVAMLGRNGGSPPFDEADLRMAEELGRRLGVAVDHARVHHSAELAHRAKSDFLAVINHEIRTPLTAVLGYADLLAGEVSGQLNDKQKKQVERIGAASHRLLRLIEGILAYVSLESGSDRPRVDRVRIRELVQRVDDIIRPAADERGVELRVDLDGLPDEVGTDPDKVLQILLALLTNAVKFTPRGVVSLTAAPADGRLRFEVRDSGQGIPPEHLPYVFNPFWQAEQPSTRRAGGAGLGLSVAQRLARLLGGDVVITDSSPAGTTFRLELPSIAI